MKFYSRENEIAELRREREISHKAVRFTVIAGRRRKSPARIRARRGKALGIVKMCYMPDGELVENVLFGTSIIAGFVLQCCRHAGEGVRSEAKYL